MSKQIKISDEVYLRLKGYADAAYRPLGMQIEYLLDQFEGIKIVTPRTLGEHIKEDYQTDMPTVNTVDVFSSEPKVDTTKVQAPTRAQAPTSPEKVILAKINRLQDEIDGANQMNQDPDYWDVINAKREEIKSLWQEWRELTGR